MKKLNNKGYLLVEIIVAAVLAMGVAYFLINLTIRFSKTEEDIYKSISLTNDKNILTNMIMEDIEEYGFDGIGAIDKDENDKIISIELKFKNGSKNLSCSGNIIGYGVDYSKQLDSSLIVGNIVVEKTADYFKLVIPITSIYSDEDYGIKLFVPILD